MWINGCKGIASLIPKWLKVNKDWIIPLSNIIVAIVALSAFYFNIQSDRRAEIVLESQMRPVVQAKPVNFRLAMGGKDGQELMGVTKIQFINYSSRTAHNVRADLKYSDANVWIFDWIAAALQGLEEKEQKSELSGQEKRWLSHYRRTLNDCLLGDLKPGRDNYKTREWTGAWGPQEGEKRISIRLRWRDTKGFEFDYVDEYRVIINKAFDSGQSFTIVPIDSTRR